MAEIVNLREFRKKRARDEKASEAARHRALAGRTTAEKARDQDAADRAKSGLDSRKLDGSNGPDGTGDSGPDSGETA